MQKEPSNALYVRSFPLTLTPEILDQIVEPFLRAWDKISEKLKENNQVLGLSYTLLSDLLELVPIIVSKRKSLEKSKK